MGLHLCYELSLPAHAREAEAAGVVRALHAFARTRLFDELSPVVRVTGGEPLRAPRVRPTAWDVASGAGHARRMLYLRAQGVDPEHDAVDWTASPPADVTVTGVAFGVLPGRGSESTAFGLARLTATPAHRALGWYWHAAPKTQYASRHGEEHLLRVHGGLLDVLEEAERLGAGVVIRDEFGYWPGRDLDRLRASLEQMNRWVAGIAGALTDAVRDAGGDSRGVHAPIFADPEFERLETEARGGGSA